MPCKICREKGHNARSCKLLTPSSVPVDTEEQNTSTLIVCPPKKYYCYIVKQINVVNSLTYVGYRVNYKRRIRQHNCIIKGGAIFTKKRGPWTFLALMSCPTWNNIRAMQVEWNLKYPQRKKKVLKSFKGPSGKIASIVEVFKRIPDEEIIDIYIHPEFYDMAISLHLPKNIKICQEITF